MDTKSVSNPSLVPTPQRDPRNGQLDADFPERVLGQLGLYTHPVMYASSANDVVPNADTFHAASHLVFSHLFSYISLSVVIFVMKIDVILRSHDSCPFARPRCCC